MFAQLGSVLPLWSKELLIALKHLHGTGARPGMGPHSYGGFTGECRSGDAVCFSHLQMPLSDSGLIRFKYWDRG